MLWSVIVDDEPLARGLLGLLLTEQEDIQIVAKCQNGREAIEYLQSMPADLLFLDVQMPEVDGFDVVQRIEVQHLLPTVFVTAHHEYDVRAFDVHALDYLTKPVDAERLKTALLATPGQHFLHSLFLAEVPLADELDLDAGLRRQPLSILAQLVAERLGETRVVEDPHLALVKTGGHSGRKAELRQRSEDEYPIPAAQHTGILTHIAL